MATGRIGVTPTLRTRWSDQPTAGTTSLSGLDDNSVALVYDVGYEAVYRNGVLLSRGNDYTATDGTTVTLTEATIAGDIIEIFANQLVPLADAISKGQYTAKGALLSATAASTPGVLTVGTDGQVLTAASGQSTGLQWATPATPATTKSYALLSTTTVSTGTSYTVTGLSGYDNLYVIFKNIRVTDSGNNATKLQINSVSSGCTFFGSTVTPSTTFTTIVQVTDATAPFKIMGNGTVGNQDLNGYFYIQGANTSGVKMITQATFVAPNGSSLADGRIGTGTSTDSAVVSSLTLSTTGTAFTSNGQMLIYGAV